MTAKTVSAAAATTAAKAPKATTNTTTKATPAKAVTEAPKAAEDVKVTRSTKAITAILPDYMNASITTESVKVNADLAFNVTRTSTGTLRIDHSACKHGNSKAARNTCRRNIEKALADRKPAADTK